MCESKDLFEVTSTESVPSKRIETSVDHLALTIAEGPLVPSVRGEKKEKQGFRVLPIIISFVALLNQTSLELIGLDI